MNIFKRIWRAILEPFVEEELQATKTADEYLADLVALLGADVVLVKKIEVPKRVTVTINVEKT